MSDEKTTPQPLNEEEASKVVGGTGSLAEDWATQAKQESDAEAAGNSGGE